MSSAIRYVLAKPKAGSKTASLGSLHLSCLVKPNVSSQHAGITSVTPEQIRLSVAAEPRNFQSNKEVRELISEVLGVPKSDVDISKPTLKSKAKTIVITNVDVGSSPDAYVESIRNKLQEAIIN